MINPVYSPAANRYESGIRFRRAGRGDIRRGNTFELKESQL